MKNRPDITSEHIEQIPLFSKLSRAEILPLIESAHYKSIQADEFFFFQGDSSECMYVLIRGRVKLMQVGREGKQALIRVIKPVHLFGLVAMTSLDTYPVSAQAGTYSSALYWTRPELMNYVMNVPQIALNAMCIMAEQLQELQDRYLEATTKRVEQRLAHTLMRLAATSGKKVEAGILIDHALSRQDLAEMSGTTLFTASRIISQWEGQDIVMRGRERVIIRNPHGLARIIEEAVV